METLQAGKKTKNNISNLHYLFCSAAKLPGILGSYSELKNTRGNCRFCAICASW